MALEQRLNLRMQQRLVMTPSLQQAIRLLQLSKLELAEEIAQELVENPVLEEQEEQIETADAASEIGLEVDVAPPETTPTPEAQEPVERDSVDEIDLDAYFREPLESGSAPNMREDRELPSIENQPASAPALSDHLLWQLGMHIPDTRQQAIARAIIGNIDEDGYLQATDEEVLESLRALAEDDPMLESVARTATALDVERTRKRIMRMDPIGVGARTLEECLLAQLDAQGLGDSLEATTVSSHIDLLRQHKFPELGRRLGCTEERAREIADLVRGLNPKPGSGFGVDKNVAVIPDVVVTKMDGEYKVTLNDEGLPRLRISPVYRRLLEQARAAREAGQAGAPAPGPGQEATPAGPDRETRDYVREKFRSALWFMKSLDQRQQTIFKVAESIVRHQRGFLDHGIEALKPMVLRDVAEDVGMHESTISRVVTSKYMHTPRGVYEMKFFFHSGLSTGSGQDISSLTVKDKIKKLIDEEQFDKPLSDSAIVKILAGQAIDIARRTVAKYRDELGIPASPMRKRG
jgi:RNA polymerase sigma-54 factor